MAILDVGAGTAVFLWVSVSVQNCAHPQGKGYDEDRTGALAAGDLDCPPMRLNALPGNPQSNAEASKVLRGNGTVESLKDSTLLFGGDAQAMIDNHQAGQVPLAIDSDLDRLALAELQRIGDQVADHCLQDRGVPISKHRATCPDHQFRSRALDRI